MYGVFSHTPYTLIGITLVFIHEPVWIELYTSTVNSLNIISYSCVTKKKSGKTAYPRLHGVHHH
jgi:hypothetical protein